MSKEDAKKFLEKLEKDSSFRSKVLKAKTTEDREKVIKELHHLNFTKKELEEAFKELHNRPLSNEELQKLAAAGKISADLAHAPIGWIATIPIE